MINKPRQLLIIGDSSVYGWGDNQGGGWSERLRKNFMNLPNAPVIYPLGIRGDGLENVAKRWKNEWLCRGELRRKCPDGILLAVGLNDTARIGQSNGRNQLSSEAYSFGLNQLIKDIKSNTDIFLIGLTPVDESAMPFAECLWYSNKECSVYESKIEEACLELDVPFLPTYRMLKEEEDWLSFIEPDGIHLNEIGHNWIYKQIINWKPLLDWSGLQRITTLTPI